MRCGSASGSHRGLLAARDLTGQGSDNGQAAAEVPADRQAPDMPALY